ncbi:MAG: tRNA-dihydrouridine synthase family protein [Myxococcota bacterium]
MLPFFTVLAPMEGVGHPTFRALMAQKGGIDLLCTEFVRISRAPISADALHRSVVKAPGVPLSVQVMGNDADKMADAARHVADAGADIVDINLGCPMPRVVRKGVGAAMLKDPALLYRVLSEMRRALEGSGAKLSAKIRAGFDDAKNVCAIAKVVEDAGADFIAVHPRRRCDFYEGVADWRIVALLAETLSIPVVGNGDAWYAADALRMEAETGCAAVMMGRPAMRNPWIFRQVTELRLGTEPFAPTVEHVAEWLHLAHESYVHGLDGEGLPQARGGRTALPNPLGKLKELVRWLGRAVDDDGAFRKKALRSQSTEAFFAAVDGLCTLDPSLLDLDAHGSRGLERSGSALPGVHAVAS